MGKKNKKLKKKKPAVLAMPGAPEISIESVPDTSNSLMTEKVSTVIAKSEKAEAPKEFQYVRGDVKRILLLLLGLVIMLGALYFVDLKTGYLSDFGNWLYKVLNIQAQ